MKLRYLTIRNRTFHYRRFIPPELRPYLNNRREFKRSLKTSDEATATYAYAHVHKECEELFAYARAATRSGEEPNSESKRAGIEKIRGKLGLTANVRFDPENQSVSETIRSLGPFSLPGSLKENPGRFLIDAVLGDTHSQLRLSETPQEYFNLISHEETNFNTRQIAKRHKPVELAYRELISVIGDINLFDLNRDQVKNFIDYCKINIDKRCITPGTANKKLTHIKKFINRIFLEREIDCDNPFRGIKFREIPAKRSAFDFPELQKLFADGNLSGLSADCRAMIEAMADTGCSMKELCQLSPDRDIHLSDDIPHLRIRENEFGTLKTRYRDRTIPLVGLAHKAFQSFPRGFERYRKPGGPEAASANTMKFLRGHGLLPTPGHTVYSLRHSFKDRLREANVPQEAQDRLMGHKPSGMGAHYGSEFKLQQLLEYMNNIKKIE